MIIDCGQCAVRGDACTDCVVTFLTIGVREAGTEHDPQQRAVPDVGLPADLDAAERGAIDVLARSGLVPPLRLRTG
jgi:hypothetical protein